MLLAFAQVAAETVHGAAEAGGHVSDEHGSGDILMHHVLDGPLFGLPSKHLVFLVFTAAVVLLVGWLARRSYGAGRAPRGIGTLVERFVVFIRDDIAEANIGHDGHKYVPLLCSFFFFILAAALMGLVPFPNHEAGKWSLAGITATGNIAVTIGLATVSFFAQQYAGISKYGVVHHFKNLVPPGLPMWLLPIMIPVEIMSMLTKPFALLIRLFANMVAGHLVITALLLLIPQLAAVSIGFGLFIAPVSVGLSLFIMVLELLVALIQAYIFTLLTAIFIGMYAHPAH